MRRNKRHPGRIRNVTIKKNFIKTANGSVLISAGDTKVICTATVQEGVPAFLAGSGKGWVTAEYGMLPASTTTRRTRVRPGKVDGRSQEIQRLIGRSLRAVTRLEDLGEKTFLMDCDVIQADGGTRTTSITGAYVALWLALERLVRRKLIKEIPLKEAVAAVSVGKVGGRMLLDLDYSEDSAADVDMNLVMTESGKIVEIQGTAEGGVFSKNELDAMIKMAAGGIKELIAIQKKALR